MSRQSPKFLLKVADAIVDEATQKIKVNFESAYSGSMLGTAIVGGLFGLKASAVGGIIGGQQADKSAARTQIQKAEDDLDLALKLTDTVIQADPNITLDDGTTPAVVKAMVFFYRGYFTMGKNEFAKALDYFKESIKYSVDQNTYFNMGLCFSKTTKGGWSPKLQTEEAVEMFQKCIELNPETEIAINAGKELARIGRL